MDGLAPIRAAGGVLWRHGMGGREIMLVHRPRHDDWTLPKGKLEPGEHPLVAAVREVWEETGVRAKAGARLPTVHYDVWAKGRLAEKTVDYWAMTVVTDDGFHQHGGSGDAVTPGQETDLRSWLSVPDALARLSYPHDMKVLAAFAELPPLRDPVVLLRHTSAGSRAAYAGPDAHRPLDDEGMARARALAEVLVCLHPTRLVCAPARRCVQTLEPLAMAVDLPIEAETLFDESAAPADATAHLRRYAERDYAYGDYAHGDYAHGDYAHGDAVGPDRDGGCVVVCSQGRLIPPMLALLSGGAPSAYQTAKGAAWVLFFADNGLAALDLLPH